MAPASENAPAARISPAAEETPGLPGFRTWRGVYVFVLVVFAAVVIALTVFSRVFA